MALNLLTKWWPLKVLQSNSNSGELPTSSQLWSSFQEELANEKDLTSFLSIRLIVFRESRSKGRKCLFDSDSVTQEDLASGRNPTPRKDFAQIYGDKYGYKYHSRQKDVSQISEMIFGSVPVSQGERNFKLFPMDNPEDILISFLTDVMKNRNGSKATSFNSSFGSNVSVSSLADSLTSDFDTHSTNPKDFHPRRPNSRPDSGIYAPCSHGRHVNASDGSSIDRLLSGHSCQSEQPEGWGSDLSFQLRWRSVVESGSLGSIPQTLPRSQQESLGSISSFKAVIDTPSSKDSGDVGEDRFCSDSSHKSVVDYLQVRVPYARPSEYTTVGVGLIIGSPLDCQHLLLQAPTFINETLSELKASVLEAMDHKPHFAHIVFHAWRMIHHNLINFFQCQRMSELAWHRVTRSAMNRANTANDDHLGSFCQDLKVVLQALERKSNMFFFSNTLSAVLTHQLGWVASFGRAISDASAPSSGFTSENPGGGSSLLSSVWYNPSHFQYKSLMGMIGNPPKSCKTLILGDNEPLLKALMNVLSYFLRCSIVMENKCQLVMPDLDQIVTQHIPVGTPEPQPGPRGQKLRRVQTTIGQLSDSGLASRPLIRRRSSASDEVTFIVGENEKLLTQATAASLERRLAYGVGGVEARDSIPIAPESEEVASSGFTCEDVILPMPKREIVSQGARSLKVFTCIHTRLTLLPGSVLQGIRRDISDEILKDQVRFQLRSYQEHAFLFPRPTQASCIVANLSSRNVFHLSPNQSVDIPICSAPIVSQMVDHLLNVMDHSPLEILSHIEHHLKGIMLQSYLLSEYLLSVEPSHDLRRNIKEDLDIDVNDLQLLMAIASVHTPDIGQKFGLSFIQEME